MSKQKPASSNHSKVIICDTNVVIQMAIFKASVMLESAKYSFGEIEVHPANINELRRWNRPGHPKKERLGDVLQLAIEFSEKVVCSLPELAEDELRRKLAQYDAQEQKLVGDDADTSHEDKLILALADKHKCMLATQEKNLRTVASKVIANRLISFEDMIVDLFESGQLTKDDIKNGMDFLAHFKENLRTGQRGRILDLLKS